MEIEITRNARVDDDRRVIHGTYGDLAFGSIWITGIACGKPRVSWPETKRGYPILAPRSEHRARIDRKILAAVIPLDDDDF